MSVLFVGFIILFRKMTMRKRIFVAGISATSFSIGVICILYVLDPDGSLACSVPFQILFIPAYTLGIHLHFKKMYKKYLQLKYNNSDPWSVRAYERMFVLEDKDNEK